MGEYHNQGFGIKHPFKGNWSLSTPFKGLWSHPLASQEVNPLADAALVFSQIMKVLGSDESQSQEEFSHSSAHHLAWDYMII